MKYPGQSGTWRTITLAIIAGLLLIIVIANAWSNAMPWSTRNSTWMTGSAGYDGTMMDFTVSDSYEEKISASSAAPSAGETAATADQKIIKTAELSITVDGVQASVDEISAEASKQQGFTQSSQVYEDVFGNLTGWITIRVPADTFEMVIASIKNGAVNIESETRNAQDVTEEYTDLAARLTAAEAQELQYLAILQDTATVGEVLAVQEHLADVRAQIESLQGQINYLENRTSFSTITVYLSEETRISIPTERFDLVRDFKEAMHYVIVLAQQTLTVIIWVLVFGVTVGTPVAALAWIGWKITKRLRRK